MSTQKRVLLLSSLFWVLLLGGLTAGLALEVWKTRLQAREQLDALEPRMARLLGLAGDKARLDHSIQALHAQIGRHAYSGTREATQAGNDAQQRVRDLLTRAGLEVVQIQVLPARQTGSFDRIPIVLRCDGELAALHAALASIASSMPTLYVEGFTMQSSAAQDARVQRVAAELQLFVLRARS